MKTGIYLIAFFFLSLSCSDVNKSKQLNIISDLNASIDSLKSELNKHTLDSATLISREAVDIELRIKNYYVTDTLDFAFAEKMDRFKNMRRAMSHLNEKYDNISKGCDEVKESLRQLKYDIENGDGERAKYEEYLVFEKSKFDNLKLFCDEYIETRTTSYATYQELGKEIRDFSMLMLEKYLKKK